MNRATSLSAVFVAVLSLAAAGCAVPLPREDTMEAKSQAKSAPELLQRMLDVSNESLDLHGGQWTYLDEARTPWDGTRTSGYMAENCPGVDGSYRFANTVFGPPVEDPEAAVDKYVSHFEQQGFTEVNRFNGDVPPSGGEGYYITVSVKDDEGTKLIYQAGQHLSSLSVEGACSDDPAMYEKTT